MEECDCLALHLSSDHNEVACREMEKKKKVTHSFDFSCPPIISSLMPPFHAESFVFVRFLWWTMQNNSGGPVTMLAELATSALGKRCFMRVP